jgi:hypothetical protein
MMRCARSVAYHCASSILWGAMQTDADSLPLASDFHVGKAKRSFLAFIMSALHASRQLQARRVLSQNRHLIADPEGRLPHESNSNFGGQENARR